MKRHIYNAKKCQSVLLIIDVQSKLAPAMTRFDEVVNTTLQLLNAAQLMAIPTVITQQYKQGLGATEPQIVEQATDAIYFDKTHFSACQEPEFISTLNKYQKPQIIIVGMEAHVCVLQTALDLLASDYQVFIIAGGVSSRRDNNRDIAIAQLRQAGAVITSAESVIFQWAEVAATPQFKDILKIVK
ncbi:hydrolase [Pseudoalteromonas sp.]|uniref:hydrolase n=1 Tax=Pseudoalteromonas sp. TaxID=53249 RepID=UPI003F961E7D